MSTIESLPRQTIADPRPRNRVLAVVLGVLGGIALATVWSAKFVDQEVGMSVSNAVLGHDAKQTAIAGSLAGIAFAFVSGFAGTLTACNIAVFGALPMVTGESASRSNRARTTLRGLGWLALGCIGVSAVYGFVAVLLGSNLPQLNTSTIGAGVPVRLTQSIVVFGLIGLAFGYLGLAALGFVRDPFARSPRTRLIVMGGLIGAFLIGRPYPLFFKLLQYAVDRHNPFYGAFVFVLQALGNIIVMAVIALLLTTATGPAAARWLTDPPRAAVFAGVALLLLGTFLVVYWDVRLPARFGYGWFPNMPWNT